MQWNEILDRIDMKSGLVMIMETSKFTFESFGEDSPLQELKSLDSSRILEMRIFDKDQEWHLFRDTPADSFHVRHADDRKGLEKGSYFDEDQYLDIDTARSKDIFVQSRKVRATGGGIYTLPQGDMEDAVIRVRSYVSYDGDGQAYIRDFRLVMKGEKNGVC